MKISARNVLKGKVRSVTHGAVNSEISVELGGGVQVVSIITKTSAENLRLAPGQRCLRHRQGFQRDDRHRLN
jgi:molybdopterin-binding protein